MFLYVLVFLIDVSSCKALSGPRVGRYINGCLLLLIYFSDIYIGVKYK